MAAAVADQATGCRQNPSTPRGGPLWVKQGTDGRKLSDKEARQLFRTGTEIEAPNAGAGSYGDILDRLGFPAVETEDTTSSAGDWTFRVPSGIVCQSNRYPRCGFAYQYQRKRQPQERTMTKPTQPKREMPREPH